MNPRRVPLGKEYGEAAESCVELKMLHFLECMPGTREKCLLSDWTACRMGTFYDL